MKPGGLQIFLGTLCVAMGLAIGWAQTAPNPRPVEPSALPPKDEIGEVVRVSDRTASSLTEIKTRPPFWPDRQVPTPVVPPVPIAPPAPPPPPPPSPGSDLALVGIVNGPAARIAVFRVKSSGKLERHVEGEAIGQWSLKRILIDRVVLLRGEAEDELAFPPPGERKSGQSVSPGVRNIPLQLVPLAPPPRPQLGR